MKISTFEDLDRLLAMLRGHGVTACSVDGIELHLAPQQAAPMPLDSQVYDPKTGEPISDEELLFGPELAREAAPQ